MVYEWTGSWQQVWERDDPYHGGDRVFFQRDRGELLWVGAEGSTDDATRDEAMSEVLADPHYEEIMPLRHGEHHQIFAEWRATLPRQVTDLCNPASIGGFREDLELHFPTDAERYWDEWSVFHDAALRRRATAWLADRGFEVTWAQHSS